MSGKISKSQIPVIHQAQLPQDARVAIVQFKNAIKQERPMELFHNKRSYGAGSPLPNLADGCCYYEFRVGHAHPGDRRQAGSRRLVAEVAVKPREIRELYFSDSHYMKGSFLRIR